MTVGYMPRMPIKQFPTPGVPQGLPDPTVMNALPTMGNHMMPPTAMGPYQQQAQGLLGNQQPGPYGAQALQLAGLLGFGGQQQLPVGSPYTPGLFMPGFRPGVDTPIIGGGGKPPYQRSRV